MTGPDAAWEEGERRRTTIIGWLTVAVAVLAVGVLALTGLALDQRERLTTLGTKNDNLTTLLNGRTPIIARIDKYEQRSFCVLAAAGRVVEEFGRLVLVTGEEPSLDQLEARVEALEDAIEGTCKEDP